MLRYKLRERNADKEFAERRRIPIQEVAEQTGIARNTLSRMINAHGVSVRSENLDRLCAYFDCRIEDLVEYVPDPANETRTSARQRKA
jgi:putative transcriptional regulator